MEIRARSDDDLDACERLARSVHQVDGYPPRFSDDLRHFVSVPDAMGAWVAVSDGGLLGHVALQPRSTLAVMALACEATGRPQAELCVVSRLFVSPEARRTGLGYALLAHAAEAGRTRGLWPVLDVATHLAAAVSLYERAGWVRAGRVTSRFVDEEPLEEFVYVGPAPGDGRR